MYISIPEFFPKHTACQPDIFFSDRREALQHCDLKEMFAIQMTKIYFSYILGVCLRAQLTVPETLGISCGESNTCAFVMLIRQLLESPQVT